MKEKQTDEEITERTFKHFESSTECDSVNPARLFQRGDYSDTGKEGVSKTHSCERVSYTTTKSYSLFPSIEILDSSRENLDF